MLEHKPASPVLRNTVEPADPAQDLSLGPSSENHIAYCDAGADEASKPPLCCARSLPYRCWSARVSLPLGNMVGSVQEPLGSGQDVLLGRPHILRLRPCLAGAEQPAASAHSGAPAHRKARRGQDDPLFVCSSQRGHRTDTAGGYCAISQRAVEAQPSFSDMGLSWAGADLVVGQARFACSSQGGRRGSAAHGCWAVYERAVGIQPTSISTSNATQCSTRHCTFYEGT